MFFSQLKLQACKMILSKDDFYSLAKKMRATASRAMDFGASGFRGGIDGESCSSTFFMVVQSVDTDFINVDQDAWAIDIGSGTGIASMAYFNGGMGLNMVGIECNIERLVYSLRLQRRLLERGEFKEIAKMSQFFEGDGLKGLIEILGSSDPIVHLKLIYWFRDGWDPHDIEDILDYINTLVINLEWFICDMSQKELEENGFKGHIISSVSFQGPMNKSSNSRTLFVHHVRMHAAGTVNIVCEREKSIITSFKTSAIETHSRVTVLLEQYRIRADYSKKDRAAFLKRKRSVELAPGPIVTREVKIKKARLSPRFGKSAAKEAQSRTTVALKPRQIQSNYSKKDRVTKLKPKRSIKRVAKPKTPEIKIVEPKRSPRIKAVLNKEKSKRQLMKEKQESKREAKRQEKERSRLEVLDWISNLEESGAFVLSP